MNDRITAGAMVLMVDLAAAAKLARWFVTDRPTPGRHRAAVDEFVPLDDLLGPPSPWLEFEHAPGVVRQEFRDCAPCGQATAGVRTVDGWWCGECLAPAGTEAAA